ncbi:MAG TPA: hypothetical protein ENI23_10660 [bacterium]|nr:hypothetical protein [bacterium]
MKLKLIRFIGNILYKIAKSNYIGYTDLNQMQEYKDMPKRRRRYTQYVLTPFFKRFILPYAGVESPLSDSPTEPATPLTPVINERLDKVGE